MSVSNSVGMNVLADIGKMLIGIKIDADEWVGKTASQKFKYLKSKFAEKGYGEMVNVGTSLVSSILGICRANTKSKIAHQYIGLAETALGLVNASIVINNAFISETKNFDEDNDELARFMGYRSAREIYTNTIETTPEICKAFLKMDYSAVSDHKVKQVKSDFPSDPKHDGEATPIMYVARLLLTIDGTKVGFEVGYVMGTRKETDLDDDNGYSYIVYGGSPEDVVVPAEIEQLIYSNYINTIDVEKNYIKIDGGKLRCTPRVNVDFDIKNIDVEDITKTMKIVLEKNMRRGYMLEGDAGTGKTISVHKLMMSFPTTPIFWISSDSINDAKKIRSVFRLLNMFPGSIFVFDDVDGNDFSIKNQLTTTFIQCIDRTLSTKFSGILFLTINEPQRIHGTIKGRAERIDEVILVKNPGTPEQIADVVVQRFKHINGSQPSDEQFVCPDWVDASNESFIEVCDIISSHYFTHAHIAGVVSDMLALYPTDYSCDVFKKLVEKRVASINNSRMVADQHGHIVDLSK